MGSARSTSRLRERDAVMNDKPARPVAAVDSRTEAARPDRGSPASSKGSCRRGRARSTQPGRAVPAPRQVAAQLAIVVPVVGLFYRVRDADLGALHALDGPVVFTPNHCLHLDNAILLARLPLGLRWRLSFAAAADTIYKQRLRGMLASVLANAFPLAREGGVRHSLEMLGARLDRGFSVVIYPEGKLTLGGPMQPFKPGIGLIAVEGPTSIVPVKLDVHRMSILDRRSWRGPIRGEVSIRVGAPISFSSDTDAASATTVLERALAAL